MSCAFAGIAVDKKAAKHKNTAIDLTLASFSLNRRDLIHGFESCERDIRTVAWNCLEFSRGNAAGNYVLPDAAWRALGLLSVDSNLRQRQSDPLPSTITVDQHTSSSGCSVRA